MHTAFVVVAAFVIPMAAIALFIALDQWLDRLLKKRAQRSNHSENSDKSERFKPMCKSNNSTSTPANGTANGSPTPCSACAKCQGKGLPGGCGAKKLARDLAREKAKTAEAATGPDSATETK